MGLKITTAKKWTLLFFLLAAGKFSNAQRLDIFGGVNLTGFNHQVADKKQDNSGTVNFHGGLGVFVAFKPKAYAKSDDASGLFPTLQYTSKATSKATVVNSSPQDVKLSYLQLNLPITYLGGSYGIGIGPYAAYAISGTKKFRSGSNTSKQSIDFGNDIKRLDYGVSVNMILSIFKIQYDLGLANIGAGTNGVVKTRNFSLSINIPLVQP